MRLRSSIVAYSLAGAVLGSPILYSAARAQTGTVVSHTKISDTAGGFLEPLSDSDEFGGGVANLGDLDGPGPSVAALAVGAPFDDDGGSDRGAVYVLFLAASGSVLSYQKISDTAGGFTATLDDDDQFGSSVAPLGDLDGPGPSVAALAVGAPFDDDGGSDRGAVYVLFLAASGSVLSYQKISDTEGGFLEPLSGSDEFGGAVAGLGDLDGAKPSAGALAIGAIGDDDGGSDRGAVYVLFLAAAGNVLSYQKISDTAGGFLEPLSDTDELGSSVAWLGDLDGVGPSAVAMAVGAIGDDDGGSNRGACYVMFLADTGSVTSYQKISDTAGGFTAPMHDDDELGGAVAFLGDLDGPGPSALSVAIGAAGDDDGGTDRGAVYVVLLNAAGSALSYQKISHTLGNFAGKLDNEDGFGGALVALGDIGGPGGGATTLAVGTSADDDGGTDRGAAYLLSLAGAAVAGVSEAPPAVTLAVGNASPNPFTVRTRIPFRLSASARTRIEVRDAGGRRVRTLVDGWMTAGEHAADWDGTDDSGRRVAAGTYFLKWSEGRGRTRGVKLMLLK